MNAVTGNVLAIDGGVSQVFDHVDNAGPMWAGSGKRWARTVIRFGAEFSASPTVQLSIAMIDADSSRNLRIDLYAEDVTRTSFTAVAHTWNDTRIGRLQVNWTAIGTNSAGLDDAWTV